MWALGVRALTDHEIAFNQLKWALQALAQPPDVQPTLFPDFVVVADELALEFDNWYRATIWRDGFTTAQKSALAAVDQFLAQMSDAKNSELWQIEALINRPEWQQVRQLAVEALQSLGW